MTTTATMTTQTFLLTYNGHDGQAFDDEAAAIQVARSRPESWVLCIAESGGYVTRQRVWPTVGPVYSNHS